MIDWRPVLGWEGLYSVSNDGRVRSERSGKLLTNVVNGRDYMIVGLYRGGACKTVRVHRLVAQAFIANPENKPEVNHIDLNRHNNCVENLEWATGSENCQHAGRMGLNHAGTNPKKNFKLTPAQVEEIKRRRAAGESSKALGREFKIDSGYVRHLCLGERRPLG